MQQRIVDWLEDYVISKSLSFKKEIIDKFAPGGAIGWHGTPYIAEGNNKMLEVIEHIISFVIVFCGMFGGIAWAILGKGYSNAAESDSCHRGKSSSSKHAV